MRLIHVRTQEVHLFQGELIPPYAILSHTWLADHEEVTFSQIQMPAYCSGMAGYKKIEYLCYQAALDGIDYVWIDTCCIDKTNSAELSEAINSMFHWYFNAKMCYVYLSDVYRSGGQTFGFLDSRWWSRSWTLQELVASPKAQFYDRDWKLIGSKAGLASKISLKTRIDEETLHEPQIMHFRSVAQRMSWAAQRVATRIEDQAYSLIGIFGINMSMQYGEGENAFIRLQQEILKSNNDLSLFAWSYAPSPVDIMAPSGNDLPSTARSSQILEIEDEDSSVSATGMFAKSPASFMHCSNIIFHHRYAPEASIAEFNGALRMDISLIDVPSNTWWPSNSDMAIGLIPCGIESKPEYLLGILLQKWESSDRFQRISPITGVFTFKVHCIEAVKAEVKRIWIDNMLWMVRFRGLNGQSSRVHRSLQVKADSSLSYTIKGVISDSDTWMRDVRYANAFTFRGTDAVEDEVLIIELWPLVVESGTDERLRSSAHPGVSSSPASLASLRTGLVTRGTASQELSRALSHSKIYASTTKPPPRPRPPKASWIQKSPNKTPSTSSQPSSRTVNATKKSQPDSSSEEELAYKPLTQLSSISKPSRSAIAPTLFLRSFTETIPSTTPSPGLYIALYLSASPSPDSDKVLVLDAPELTPERDARSEARDLKQVRSRLLETGTSAASVHRGVRAVVRSRQVFNQVVTTLEVKVVKGNDEVVKNIVGSLGQSLGWGRKREV